MVKPSESIKTLSSVADVIFYLVEQFKGCELPALHSYNLLEKVFNDQCNLNISGNKKAAEVKKPKNIPSNSLQYFSDTNATYSCHKSQGYKIKVMARPQFKAIETYTDTKKSRDKSLNLITHVQ